MSFLEHIYDNSPIFFQNFMCSVKGYSQKGERYGRKYWEYRKIFEDIDRMPLETQKRIQQEKLKELINYANENSVFYSELYKNIDLKKINTVEDIQQLPIVDKEMIRSNIDKVMTVPAKNAVIQHTGGTTGKSLTIRQTKDDSFQRMAMLDNFKARVGFENLKMRRATFNGKHIIPPKQKKKVFWRYNASCKQMIYSSFHLTEENMGEYVESLNRFKPLALDGFFSSMCDLASFIERRNLKLSFQPIAIFPTSETLTESGRDLLERVFMCKVYDQYASSEGAPFATECPKQKMHIELTSGVFEKANEDNEILVTSFTSHGTPLIRYQIGDRMIISSDESCSCGLCGPIVKEIQGRRLDYLFATNGAKINAGNVSNLLKNLPNSIIRAQFIQDTMNEITVLLEVENGELDKGQEQKLRDEFLHKFGSDMKVNIFTVSSIPREKSGKFRMIKNNVDIHNKTAE